MGTDSSDHLIVAITARALFDLEDSHALFERDGVRAYAAFQRERENEILKPGIAFPLVRKLAALNAGAPEDAPRAEVVLLSRNSSDTGLRIFNSIEHYGLGIVRAVFTAGEPTDPYIKPFGAQLFLSANPASVRRALEHGVAAATILPSNMATESVGIPSMVRQAHHERDSGSDLAHHERDSGTDDARAEPVHNDQIRIAFDGDAVIFGDESQRISSEQGLAAFSRNESERAHEPLSGGPFKGFLAALHRLQQAFPAENSPIRTALVTARSAPAHKRVILTLREWGVRLDEALFLGGRDKGPFLRAFGADIFFDDSQANIADASRHVAAGHVPHGVANE